VVNEIRPALDRVVGRAVEMRASVGRMVVPPAARKDGSLTQRASPRCESGYIDMVDIGSGLTTYCGAN
jgi:hypothetical protein